MTIWPPPSGLGVPLDGLETVLFNGENFPEVYAFLRGDAYLLRPNAILVDAPDRVFLVRTGDVIVRYPNGTLGRHRPPAVRHTP